MARNILVVEDDRNISDLIRMYLEKEGFEVTLLDVGSTGTVTPQQVVDAIREEKGMSVDALFREVYKC